jgi:hypothetical protein
LASEPPKNPPPSKPNDRDAAAQDGFLREVDEALREEQMVDAVKRWAKPVGAAIVVTVLAMAGYMAWDNINKQASGEITEKIILALDKVDSGQLDLAAKELTALQGKGSDGNRAVVAMSLAAIAMEQGKPEEAAKKFAAIAADSSMPKPYRDLATIREISIRYDSMKPDDVIARLKPMAVPGNAFFGSAGELLGMAYLDAGKPELAGPLFAQIGKDKNVPEGLRKRARQIAGGLGFDGGEEVPTDIPDNASGAAADAAAATTAKS